MGRIPSRRIEAWYRKQCIRGRGRDGVLGPRGLVNPMKMRHPAGGGRLGLLARIRRLCAMSFGGLCEVMTLTAFSLTSWRKRGPRCDFVWEGVRVSSAGSQHLTVVLCVRPCSITTRLPCVAEGGPFFAAADPAGERSPSETIGRYTFFQVRRACAPMLRSRKSLICNRFVHLLVSRGENEAFWGSSHDVPLVSLF